jgi:hypothetical protein
MIRGKSPLSSAFFATAASLGVTSLLWTRMTVRWLQTLRWTRLLRGFSGPLTDRVCRFFRRRLPKLPNSHAPPAGYRPLMGARAMAVNTVAARRTPDFSRERSAFAPWWPRVPEGQAHGRVARWRVWLRRARNVVTVIFLAAAYALRERRAWMGWQIRHRPPRWMALRLASAPRQRSEAPWLHRR